MRDLTGKATALKQVGASLDWADRLNPSQLKYIHQQAAKAMQLSVRGFLAQNYVASGLKVRTGALYRASVSMARVIAGGFNNAGGGFTITAVYVKMAQGFDAEVYESAGVFRYGGVRAQRGSVMEAAGLLGVAHTQGKGGAKQKRRIKKDAAKMSKLGIDTAAGVTYIKPKPPFFQLLPEQVARVALVYQRTFVAEVNSMLTGRVGKAA